NTCTARWSSPNGPGPPCATQPPKTRRTPSRAVPGLNLAVGPRSSAEEHRPSKPTVARCNPAGGADASRWSNTTLEDPQMPETTCHMSISLDGFVAGPDQSRENPLGKRGREVHSWHLGDERANAADATAEGWLMRPRGAYVMGRNMFGPIRGEWDEDWDGWWGSEPPY